ncbi:MULTISPECIES: MarR family winged helix-turn-helix transcriptional regulator [Ralstonia]|uniref:MarR family winged helix-turn-helix transcriptional regulator n=1 Tax=Ralstonia TaxID=48736 RepID=UPI0009E626A7
MVNAPRNRRKGKTEPQHGGAVRPDSKPPSAGNHGALRVWLRLLTCHSLIETELRSQLRTRFETTLPRFDLMAQLERHPQGLKMRDLSRLLMVSGGNVTGITDRLVEEGLIERRDDPRDRRAYTVCLTDKGKTQFAEMAALHEQWVIALFDGLSGEEQGQLANLLGKLKRHLGESPGR